MVAESDKENGVEERREGGEEETRQTRLFTSLLSIYFYIFFLLVKRLVPTA